LGVNRHLPVFPLRRVAIAASLGVALLAACRSGRPVAAGHAPSAESQAVLAVVQRMFDAMRTRDTAAFREIFEPGARLVGMRVRPNGETVLQVLPWERFATVMATDPRPQWIERAFNPEVRIRGTLATVWADYDFHFASRFSHCGVDAVQLLKTPAGWKIVSIADTYETTGCPSRPPPSP
jgi:hypothetical protein